ncbi:MAG: MMPL family transporter [Campylobacterota bacterium]
MNWRLEVEKQFEHFSDLITKHRFKTLVLMLAMVLSLAINLPKITMDTSTEGFLYPDDPQILMYNDFRNQFGRDEKIIIAVKTKDVFDARFLEKLFALHSEMEEHLPYIKEVNSLKNARKTTGNEEELIVEDLFLDGVPSSAEALAEIKAYAQDNNIYENLYLSEDGSFTTIMITTNTYTSIGNEEEAEDDFSEGFDEEEEAVSDEQLPFISVQETNELILKLETIIDRYRADDFMIYDAGSPIVTKNLQSTLVADMSKFILYVIATISLLLLAMFRRISGIILPLLVVILTLLATVGSMALAGAPITSMTQILPSLLLAVGVGASVHLLAMFFHKFDETGDKNGAIAYALGHSGLAIVMTSVTTAASLSSFSISDIQPVANLGVFASLGVMLALVLTLVFLPVMLAILPIKAKKDAASTHGVLDDLTLVIADISIKYRRSIVISALVLIVGSVALASQMHFSHNPLHWFKADNSVRINTEVIDHELKGSISIEVVLDTHKENGVYDPAFLNAMNSASEAIYTFKGENYFIGKIVNVADVLKEIHMALHENDKAFYVIAQDPDLIAQEFLLFENSGSDDLEEIVDSQFSKTRLSIKAPWVDSVEYVELIEQLETLLAQKFGEEVTVSITGTLPILATTITKSIESSIESYAIAFMVIGLLMIVLIGNVKLGLLSMLPNLTPIMFGVAFMVVFDLPLDMFTILIGAIAIGMVVDDTIHYMHNFQRYYIIHKSVDEAIRLTLQSTGRAIFITSIVLSSGFFVFMFASMTNLFNFGLITGVTVLMAMVTNLFLTGALMKTFVKEGA